MAKLILSMDGLVLKEISLDKERISIGRKPLNDVQIDNLAISGEHAVVVTILSDSFLEDLNSTNGTLVNGQPIKKHFLKEGDVVELGKYKLKYLTEAVRQNVAADFEATLLTPPLPPQEDVSLLAAEPPAVALGVIKVLNGSNAGRELILSKPLTSLGQPGQQVAVISRRPYGYFLTHLEGATFPRLNGQAIDAETRQLAERDVIELSGVKMEFSVRG